MQTEHAPRASQTSSALRPSGLRRLSIAMMATDHIAERFKGSPIGDDATRPGQVLAAVKAAAPFLGYGPRVVHVLDWLFTFTQPQDWLEGSRPIVWPSAALQRDALSIGLSQTKALNRHLVELGLIAMKDSPNGKRYGRRDRQGRIIEAYGFDLSPLFERLAEFRAVAAKGQADRDRMRHLRRRCTIARKGLQQILETAAEQGLMDAAWRQMESDGRALARALRQVEQLDEMEVGVASLERRQREAQERLELQLATVAKDAPEAVDSDPKGPENRPHIITTNLTINLKDTVIADKESSQIERAVPPSPSPALGAEKEFRLKPSQLLDLAPRLGAYIFREFPSWIDIVDAAGGHLRQELGVSPSLWGEACRTMGREQAALALAIVSTKPAEHFTRGAGGYFAGMLRKAERGELRLERTLWKLKDEKWGAKKLKREGTRSDGPEGGYRSGH